MKLRFERLHLWFVNLGVLLFIGTILFYSDIFKVKHKSVYIRDISGDPRLKLKSVPKKSIHIPKDFYFQNKLIFGSVPWRGIPIANWFQRFISDFAVFSNEGGMRLPHQFAVYTILRLLQPSVVIESGVGYGKMTRVYRRILPDAQIISLDPNCIQRQIKNHRSICGKEFRDFKHMDKIWRTLDKNKTLIIFDDHQSGFLRTLQSLQFGFRYIMVEDNYRMGHGDMYSPKQVLTYVRSSVPFLDNFGRAKIMISAKEHYMNRYIFQNVVKTYAEFPPLNKNMTVRMISKGQPYELISKNTVNGLELQVPYQYDYVDYGHMCYMELNKLSDIRDEIKNKISSIRTP